jgi:peptidoglycan/xylan/chitin deacetylase (PgdA/CDA1 family)
MKRFLFALLQRTRLLKLVSWCNRKNVTILCYHSVVPDQRIPRRDPYKQHIPVSLFLQHLDYLEKNYRVISLEDFLAAKLNHQHTPNHSVVLIFDDGFEDFFSVASKELIRRQLPATVFVITEGAYGRFRSGGSYLSWGEIQNLASAGILIGSHTCSHPNLSNLSADEAWRELCDSLSAVRRHVTQAAVPLSYPYGRTSPEVIRMAEWAGYSCAINGTLGSNDNHAELYALRRTVIASDDDLVTFAARVSGLTWWAEKVRRALPRRSSANWNEELAPRMPLLAKTFDGQDY